MKIYYEKVFIKTEADLPKENGTYIICSTDGRLYEKEFKINSPAFKKSWEQWIDWYFRPVELSFPTEDEIKKMQSGMMCGDSVNCDWVDGYIDGFKAAIVEIIKRNQ